jgi:penicillin-binding protein 1A
LFVYLSALEAGRTPNDVIQDEAVNINGWRPRNNDRTYRGPVTIRQAFAQSINTISAKLGQEVGFRTVADMAQRFGITTEVNTHPSMVLGTSDVRLIDMTRAFAGVARKGIAVVPYGIRRVTTAKGELLYQQETADERTLVAPWVAAQMTDLLQTAVLTGTGRAAQIGRPVAGKTGTTSANKDGWFIGFSSGITTGVWMGRDDARPIPGLQGGRAPAAAFQDYMVWAVAKRPLEEFDTEVTLPSWQTDGDNAAWEGEPDDFLMVDPDGNPVAPDGQPLPSDGAAPPPRARPQPSEEQPPEEELNQDWLDRVTGRNRPPPTREPPRREPPPPPPEDEDF